MQRLMSNLLANAAGKEPIDPPGRHTRFHADSFILPGEYRRDIPASEASRESDETGIESVQMYTPTADNLPSYVPCYDINGYSSSPTYIRGEYYHLTPPATPELEQAHHETRPETTKVTHTFSIDSILGTDTPDPVKGDSPARVYSALTSEATSCSSGQFRFSMSDWSVFQNSSRLTSSSEASHLSMKSLFWCHVCYKFCASVEDARHHQREHSNKGVRCKLQQKFLSIHGYVTEHVETTYLNRVKCGLCNKIVTNCFFGKHMRCHTAHICDICGHESSSNGQLLKHMNIHTGHKAYKCRICKRAFGDKGQMIRHEQMHVEDKNQCRFCQKSFSTKYSRIVHERIHTGQNPYTCTFPGCNRSFPQKVQLLLHAEHHG